MANNPYVNKVIYGNDTIIDLTGDTVAPADVVSGKTFHDSSGEQKIGTLEPQSSNKVMYRGTESFTSSSESQQTICYLDQYPLKFYRDGNNVLLEIDVDGTTSSVTIQSNTAGYETTIEHLHYLNVRQIIICYNTETANGYGTAKYARLITLKNDGTLYQSATITLAPANSATYTYTYDFLKTLDSDTSFVVIRYTVTNSTGAMAIAAYNIQANMATGALSMVTQVSSTLASSNVNTSKGSLAYFSNYNVGAIRGLPYVNNSGANKIFIDHSYTQSDNIILDPPNLFCPFGIIVGRMSDGQILDIFVSRQDQSSKHIYTLGAYIYPYNPAGGGFGVGTYFTLCTVYSTAPTADAGIRSWFKPLGFSKDTLYFIVSTNAPPSYPFSKFEILDKTVTDKYRYFEYGIQFTKNESGYKNLTSAENLLEFDSNIGNRPKYAGEGSDLFNRIFICEAT